MECATEYAMEKSRKSRERQQAKALKERKETEKVNRKAVRELNKKTIKWQKEQTQPAFNRMRVAQEMFWFRSRGIEPYCISCGRENMDWCCGHLKTRGAFPELAYDEKNTFLQCNYHCNESLSGNVYGDKNSIGYLEGLKKRFGEVEGQAIIDYCESPHERKRLTWEDYEEMRAEFNRRCREIKERLSKLE